VFEVGFLLNEAIRVVCSLCGCQLQISGNGKMPPRILQKLLYLGRRRINSDDLLDPGREESDGGAGSDESSKRSMNSKEKNDLIMMFTCKVCDTRSAKTMTRDTYDNGIVIVRCPRCQKLHLIADRLWWFGEPGSGKDFLAQQGVDVRKGSDALPQQMIFQGGRQNIKNDVHVQLFFVGAKQ
jgi:protein import protein ZIM17